MRMFMLWGVLSLIGLFACVESREEVEPGPSAADARLVVCGGGDLAELAALDVGRVAHVLEAAPCCARPAPMPGSGWLPCGGGGGVNARLAGGGADARLVVCGSSAVVADREVRSVPSLLGLNTIWIGQPFYRQPKIDNNPLENPIVVLSYLFRLKSRSAMNLAHHEKF